MKTSKFIFGMKISVSLKTHDKRTSVHFGREGGGESNTTQLM
jgi:hypothetical protein